MEFKADASGWSFVNSDTGIGITNALPGLFINENFYPAEFPYDFSGDFHKQVSKDSTFFKGIVENDNFQARFDFSRIRGGRLSLNASVANNSDESLVLGKVEFTAGNGYGGKITSSSDTKQIKVLNTTGTCCNAAYPVMPCDMAGNSCVSRVFSLAYDQGLGFGIMTGFMTFDRLNCEIHTSAGESGPVVSVFCDFNGYRLPPGETIVSETVVFDVNYGYDRLLNAWADLTADHYKPKFSDKPAIGWVGGWNYRNAFIGEDSFEKIVKDNVDAIESEFRGYGIRYIWVSIGNLVNDLPGNWFSENRKRFPSGLKSLADDIASHGMALGFWIAPFWVPDKYTDMHERFGDCLLKYRGEPVHFKNAWRIGETGNSGPEGRAGFYSLDASHPKAQEFLKEVFRHYSEMGIRYFMLDFLNAGEGPMSSSFMYDGYHDQSMVNGPQVYRKAMRIIRETSGPGTYTVASTGPTLINIGLVDAVRTGPDFGEGREPLPKYPSFYPAACKTDAWGMFRKAINYYASSYHMDKKLFHIDSFNVLNIDPPASVSEMQTVVSLFAMAAGPVMLGGDIVALGKYRIDAIKKCLPQAQKGAKPLDLFEPASPEGPSLFLQRHLAGWDEWSVLYAVNTGAKTMSAHVDFHSLGVDPDGESGAYDFWDEKYLGTMKGGIDICVQPYGIRVIRLFRHRKHPFIISTDMHVSQGAVELRDVKWDEEEYVLRGTAVRNAGFEGAVVVSLPKGWLPAEYRGINVARSELHDESYIWKKIVFETDEQEFAIGFRPEDQRDDKELEAGRM
ncbi:MAG: alpha-galactosidase [Clostridia bacterium]|nr:alpha-galactosidase [Clostridia bacterium]